MMLRLALTASAVCLWAMVALLLTPLASAAGDDVINGFYVVSMVTSDASPFWYHYILHVKTDGHDSLVRYIRIAPMDAMCQPRPRSKP